MHPVREHVRLAKYGMTHRATFLTLPTTDAEKVFKGYSTGTNSEVVDWTESSNRRENKQADKAEQRPGVLHLWYDGFSLFLVISKWKDKGGRNNLQ